MSTKADSTSISHLHTLQFIGKLPFNTCSDPKTSTSRLATSMNDLHLSRSTWINMEGRLNSFQLIRDRPRCNMHQIRTNNSSTTGAQSSRCTLPWRMERKCSLYTMTGDKATTSKSRNLTIMPVRQCPGLDRNIGNGCTINKRIWGSFKAFE